MQHWLALYPLFIAPLCALCAGIFTGVMVRGEQPTEGELLRHFLIAFVLVSFLSLGLIRMPAFRAAADPATVLRKQVQAMLVAQPSLAALQRYDASDWASLQQMAQDQATTGMPLPEVLAEARRATLPIARYRISFAPRSAARAYGEALLPILRDLLNRDPATCPRAAWAGAAGRPLPDIAGSASPEMAAAYEMALARIFTENSLATDTQAPPGKSGRPPRANDGAGAALSDMQTAYRSLHNDIQQRYGIDTEELRRTGGRELTAISACRATIELLQGALDQPNDLSGALLQQLLRD